MKQNPPGMRTARLGNTVILLTWIAPYGNLMVYSTKTNFKSQKKYEY